MDPLLWIKNAKYFGPGFQPDEGEIHALVVVPEQVQPQTGLWLVSGSVENALNTKGICCRLYRLVASYLGYCDPVHRTEDKDNALWYEDKTLCIHSVFESSKLLTSSLHVLLLWSTNCVCLTEENALLFDNVVQDECITPTSPLDGHAVSTNVAPVSRELSELRRIYSRHYVPQDTKSPQVTVLSVSTNTSIVDVVTDEFKYQRIESEEGTELSFDVKRALPEASNLSQV
ncbi:hypothetical protein PI126_g2038 [Phytophthora idaei]|nr:hypothetical protein PI126_g2038 [Phytophthora idaei]